MSREIAVIEKSGSRKVPITITMYYGGKEVGVCYQLTSEMEDGTHGYVQLSAEDIQKLVSIVEKEA